ncbi:MAG TPA: LysE family transporter [Coriobacteriia bacterium]
MAALVALYARTLVIGVAVAAPVGAMGVLCIQRTLDRGWWAGMATGLGIATADGTYAALAAFGVAALTAVFVAWQTPLRLVGGAVLVYLGVSSMRLDRQRRGPRKTEVAAGKLPSSARAQGGYRLARVARVPCAPPAPRFASTYLSAVGLTFTNPMTIMAFGAVFASAGLATQPGVASAATATAGIASGSLAWWLALVTGIALARVSAGPRLITAVSRISGALIVALGALAIGSAVWPLVR